MPKTSDNTAEIILEHLRGIRADVADLKRGQQSIQQQLRLMQHHGEISY